MMRQGVPWGETDLQPGGDGLLEAPLQCSLILFFVPGGNGRMLGAPCAAPACLGAPLAVQRGAEEGVGELLQSVLVQRWSGR